jgi:hypothetical protein
MSILLNITPSTGKNQTVNNSSISEVTPPLAVSVREAARLLSISERSAWSAVKSGRLQSCRLGKRVIVPVSSIEALLQGTDDTNSGDSTGDTNSNQIQKEK